MLWHYLLKLGGQFPHFRMHLVYPESDLLFNKRATSLCSLLTEYRYFFTFFKIAFIFIRNFYDFLFFLYCKILPLNGKHVFIYNRVNLLLYMFTPLFITCKHIVSSSNEYCLFILNETRGNPLSCQPSPIFS